MNQIIISNHTIVIIAVLYIVCTFAGSFINGFVGEHFSQRRLAKRKAMEEELIALLKAEKRVDIKPDSVKNRAYNPLSPAFKGDNKK